MKRGTRYTKGAGNAALYLRARDDGSFWNFTTLAWVGSESADTKKLLTEYADASATESYYSVTFTPPTGGPWNVDIVEVSTGDVIGMGDTDEAIAAVKSDSAAILGHTGTTGVAVATASKTGYTLATTEGYKKNTAYPNFAFFMRDAVDHLSGKTGLTAITIQRLLDSGAFQNCVNSGTTTEKGSGTYTFNVAAADFNGDTVTLKFSATGADSTIMHIKLNP